MKSIYRAALAAVMLLACAAPAFAQSLATTYVTNNSFAGNTFDLRSNRDIEINSFDIHVSGGTANVAVYWRNGTSNGFQDSSAGWTLLGTASVAARGQGVGTPVPVGGLTLRAGQTYGIYVEVQNYPTARMHYTNGSNVFSNADLSLTTWYGKGNPAFSGLTFNPRQWNGAVHYVPAFISCAAEGYTGSKLSMCQKICEIEQPTSTLSSLIKFYRTAYRTDPPCAD